MKWKSSTENKKDVCATASISWWGEQMLQTLNASIAQRLLYLLFYFSSLSLSLSLFCLFLFLFLVSSTFRLGRIATGQTLIQPTVCPYNSIERMASTDAFRFTVFNSSVASMALMKAPDDPCLRRMAQTDLTVFNLIISKRCHKKP